MLYYILYTMDYTAIPLYCHTAILSDCNDAILLYCCTAIPPYTRCCTPCATRHAFAQMGSPEGSKQGWQKQGWQIYARVQIYGRFTADVWQIYARNRAGIAKSDTPVFANPVSSLPSLIRDPQIVSLLGVIKVILSLVDSYMSLLRHVDSYMSLLSLIKAILQGVSKWGSVLSSRWLSSDLCKLADPTALEVHVHSA